MSYNVGGALQGLTATLSNAGIAGLSGAAVTFSTSATGGATGIVWSNQGAIKFLANIAAVAVPVNDAGSSTAVPATAASGAAFRPLVAQQAPAGYSPNTIYVGSICCFVFGLDRAGNVRVAQGRVVQYSDTSALSTSAPLPIVPDWMTPFAYAVIKLVSATAASWTFGTGLWNAAGITIDAPVNVSSVPAVDPIGA
jgi:hypothetical protein